MTSSPRSLPRSSRRLWASTAALLAMLGVAACSSEGERGFAGDPTGGDVDACVDKDADGYGIGCASGPDCNDTDPAVHVDCPAVDKCHDGIDGCPCTPDMEGVNVDCGTIKEKYGDVYVCDPGRSTCTGGKWGACVPLGQTYSLTVGKDGAPGASAQGLGGPGDCTNNPCDPYCKDPGKDTPGGVCSGSNCTNITDGPNGPTLPLGPSVEPVPNCSAAYRGCSHHICQAGNTPPLAAGCDQAAWPTGCTATVISGRTYLLCNLQKNWTDARDFCIQQGLDLLTVSNLTENNAIGAQAAAAFSNNSWWIGLNDIALEGDFNWVGNQGITFANWNAGEPNNSGNNEDCAEQSPTNPYRWNDLDCASTRRFVCEGIPLAPAGGSCVSQVCAQMPSCCTTQWTTACLAKAKSLCAIDCAASAGACTICYRDGLDHDGDGWSFNDGDRSNNVSADCDGMSNPGAYDFPGNGVDEDVDGTPDNEVTVCDSGLPINSTVNNDYARAMELCQFTTAGATGAAKVWGVISTAIVQANGTTNVPTVSYSGCSSQRVQAAILPSFGTTTTLDPVFNLPVNAPRKGQRMAAYSSGSARRPGDSCYVNPNGQVSSLSLGTYAAPPTGHPQNKSGCPNGTAAYDSAGIKMQIRVPTNAKSFSYNVNFFTSEYPEWVCTFYNDAYIARLTSGHPLVQSNLGAPKWGNITFDLSGAPVSVNVGFFSIPGGPKATHPMLNGTGYDGQCSGQICGGATNWLQTTAPVLAGETITFHNSVWDTGDNIWDSIVLVDNWQWSAAPSGIQTLPNPPTPPPAYSPGSFNRPYDNSALCGLNQQLSYTNWTWTALTPGDSSIQFFIKAADTAGGLATATEYPLKFTNPPGPAGLVGQNAKASSALGTSNGAVWISKNLSDLGLNPKSKFVNIRSYLVPSTNGLQAPTLTSWNLGASCPPSE